MAQRDGRRGSLLCSGWNLLFVHVADLEREFIRRFLQHVLPTGFMKVRYYGFMNPNCKVTLGHIQKHDRNNQRARQRFTQSCSQTPSAHHLFKLWRPAQAAFLDSAIENFGVVRIGGYRINQSLFSERLSLGAAAQRDGGRLGSSMELTNSLPNYYATPYLTL